VISSPGVRVAAWIAVGAYLALIYWLSSQSDPLPELTLKVWDKALHAVEYGGIGFLLALAFLASGVALRRALLVAAVGASVYGASDEIHQAFVPNRSFDVRHWAADTVGAALGAAAVGISLRVRGSRASIRRSSGEVP
jgi:VanZ family protein